MAIIVTIIIAKKNKKGKNAFDMCVLVSQRM